ncbi:cyclohexanone monooxygenase [Capronia epimyces CBS 606.96]|uniref:Cyclohexanone monooxygenase n=1 Tax=Capronia epimyces CBS 606.96 TaxID=1182542 RepID=W9Y4I1_9EURO|nr:cyclohexanone monooxygenase [Capronia epimyces CBS 606.96]EXJ84555.1 cyclohexanone monooxygenase [Capronia epimyces CBS 606.96]
MSNSNLEDVGHANGLTVNGVDSKPTLNGGHQHQQPKQSQSHWRMGQPIHTARDMRVICIGAGASGLCLAYKLQRSFEKFSLTVYEKNSECSGTWHENTYPGCACDVPAHNYTYSWEPKYDWSAVYAKAPEINQYFNDFAKKNRLEEYIKLQHQVVGAHWNDSRGEWDVQVTDLRSGNVFDARCDILVNAAGILNAWRWPAIPGLHNFQGKLVHSANWDHSVELEGKRVGLIGNGSSGIQILPAIQPMVQKLVHFVRQPTWVSPVQGLEQHIYTEEELQSFRNDPNLLLELRKTNETNLDTMTHIFNRYGEAQREVRDLMTRQMKEKINHPDLDKLLIPAWSVGCRRLTPGVNYLETLTKENVEVHFGEISRMTEKGAVLDNGVEHDLDVLVCATGFDTSFRPRFPTVGLDGIDLRDLWKDEAKGYLSLAAPKMPNYFMFLGPASPIGNGPVISAIEAQVDHALMMCDRWQTENIHSFVPKDEAVADFNDMIDEYMADKVWDEDCRSWYKNGSKSNRVSALWPGSSLHCLEFLSHLRSDDWHIRYEGNRFAWSGNGASQTEMDPTADWAWYIRNEDDSPFISKGKQRKVLTKSGSKSTKKAGDAMAMNNLVGE